jgi:hypothetical protein
MKVFLRSSRCLVGLLGLCCILTKTLSAESKAFTLKAGDLDRRNCPVRFEVPEPLRAAPFLRLLDLDTMKTVPVQRRGETEAVFLLATPLPSNTPRRFRLSAAENPESDEVAVRWSVNRGAAIFRLRGQPVLALNVEEVEPPDGLGREFRRSGHIHPHNYGGMAVRGPYDWQKQRQSGILTSEGKNRIEGNNTRPDWANMHGSFDGQMCGLTIFCHPSNFRAPQAVRIHPQLTYFVFTPVRLGEFEIKPGDTYISRFRFFVQDGAPNMAKLEAIWNDYATPPVLAWER